MESFENKLETFCSFTTKHFSVYFKDIVFYVVWFPYSWAFFLSFSDSIGSLCPLNKAYLMGDN